MIFVHCLTSQALLSAFHCMGYQGYQAVLHQWPSVMIGSRGKEKNNNNNKNPNQILFAIL